MRWISIVRTVPFLFAGFAAPNVAFAVCADASNCLINPLNSQFGSSIPALIQGVLQTVMVIAIPVIAFFFIWSGFKFVTALGNEKQISDARRMFFYTVIGAALILGAWAIAQIIGTTINQVVTP